MSSGNPENLTESPGFLLAILNHLAQPVFVKDRQFRFVLVNDALCQMLGKDKSDLLGTTDYDHFDKAEADFFRLKDQELVDSGTAVVIDEEKITDAKGKVHWLNTTKVPILDADGAVTHVVGITQDITDKKEAEDLMRAAKVEAENAHRAKGTFLTHVSHEIRSPMHGILGMTQLLGSTSLNIEQKEFVQTITRSSRSLLSMLNDILDVSRIEAGRMVLEPEPFNLEKNVFDVLDLLSQRAASKGLQLEGYYPASVPREIVGDAPRLRQVLINLLSNAIKYTQSGGVLVRLSQKPGEDRALTLRLSVEDTGIGIKEEALPTLFQTFERGDMVPESGAGLGLSICQQITEFMGGRIWAERRPGGGSIFSIELPTEVPIYHQGRVAEDHPDRGLACVLMDDSLTQKSVERYLTDLGFRVWRKKGIEDFSATEREKAEGDVTVLIAAQQAMKEGEGLRALPNSLRGAACKILLVPFGEAQAQTPPEGWRHLTTPLRPHELKGEIISVSLAPKAASEQIQSQNPGPDVRVLLVEDNPVSRRVGDLLLRRMGYNVAVATTGKAALKMTQQEKYSAILMDCQLPDMDGKDVSRQIRSNGGPNAKSPIIALTASSGPSQRQEALDAGMDDFMAKPIDWATLQARLSTWTRPTPQAD